jgi:Abscisic acid G-protein coupled receptor
LGLLSFLKRHIFAVYCIYRIFTSTLSTLHLLRRTSASQTPDPLPRLLVHFLPGNALSLETSVQLINLLLVSLVIVGSVAAVVTVLARVTRFQTVPPAAATLALVFLGAGYFVSTAVMVGSSAGGGIRRALGVRLTSGVFEEWFDVVYCGVVVVTGVGLVVSRKWNEEEEFEGKEV